MSKTPLTEDQIECAVARKIDILDAQYMAHKVTEDEYKSEMNDITAWAEIEYRFRRRD